MKHLLLFLLLAPMSAVTLPAQVSDTLKQTILSPTSTRQPGAQQGYSVATDGNITAVGAPSDDTVPRSGFTEASLSNAGVVKVYDSTSGQLLHVLVNPNPTSSGLISIDFGSAIAISGTRLIVGAYASGWVYVYDLAGENPTTPVVTLIKPGSLCSNYGRSVAIGGTGRWWVLSGTAPTAVLARHTSMI